MSQSKVTVLELKPGKHKAEVPPILHTVRQSVKRPLNEMLQNLFNHSDDALFEMADRSHTDSDQHMFFESMRGLRLHRERITGDFVKAISAGFEDLFAPIPEADDAEFDENVGLVHNDELEVSVAIAGIISKITSQFSLPIMQLTKRIDHLCEGKSTQPVTERLNPLGPQRLSQAFVTALECLDVDIKVRIILLKLYERFVMERLGPIYEQANRLLIEAGVLPDLKNIVRKKRKAKSTSAPREPVEDDDEDTVSLDAGTGGRGGFGDIQRLLADTRSTSPVGGGGRAASGGPAISTPQLVSVLSAMQKDDTAQPLDLEHLPQLIDLRQLVATRAPNVTGEAPSKMQQADDDVVNFVGMLFDYILNDRNLAIPMKALIARLQIPIVKLSIIDKSFFEKTSHPARQLLNELSSAGIGWSSTRELKRDALYNKIESVVLRVLNGFSDNPNIFSELLKELRDYVVTDYKQSAIVEERVKKTEEGKAKTTGAKQAVQKVINQKASGLRLPPEIGRFISEIWSKILVYICVKHGTESEPWNAGLKTLDDLLWCIQPLNSIQDIELREGVASELAGRLEHGMDQIAVSKTQRKAHLKAIEKHLKQVAENDRTYLEDDTEPVEDDSYEELEEIILTAPHDANSETVAPEPEFLDQIEALSEGVWIELEKSPGDRIRCKLATIVQPGDLYIFVNRRGMKVAERTRMGLAVDLKRGALNVLQESQVFDRALQAVIGNLRQLRRDPT
ncbi:MAG: DUF1631 domain-containing protein [Pseudomonadales bacterium]